MTVKDGDKEAELEKKLLVFNKNSCKLVEFTHVADHSPTGIGQLDSI